MQKKNITFLFIIAIVANVLLSCRPRTTARYKQEEIAKVKLYSYLNNQKLDTVVTEKEDIEYLYGLFFNCRRREKGEYYKAYLDGLALFYTTNNKVDSFCFSRGTAVTHVGIEKLISLQELEVIYVKYGRK